jgi:hypothetical protein
MPREPLRAALFLDSPTVSAWANEAIRRAAAEGHACWSLVLLNSPVEHRQGFIQRACENCCTALASSYIRFDQFVSPADRDPFAPWDIRQLLPEIPQLPADDVNGAIAAHNLDVIVSFGRQAPRHDLLTAAKLGVWVFQHGELPDNFRPEFNGLCEVIAGRDVNSASLQMFTSDNRPVKLAEIHTAVDRLSAARNRSNLYWPTVPLLPRQLARLHKLGVDKFRAEAASRYNGDPPATSPPSVLSNHKLLPGLARLAARRLKRKWTKNVYREQWFMLCSNSESATTKLRLESFQPIIPPIDRFWADPHVAVHNGKPYVFFEEFLYKTGKAHISVMEFDDRVQWHSPRPVLERPYHLSYPFLFEWQGERYMIPETSANRTLEVYRCEQFPDRWALHKTLMKNVNAFDATLLRHAGLWWMFVTLAETGGSSSDELFLFHADHPLSDHWIPHPLNPIVSDVRRARPAGPIFTENGRLIRPAQVGSRTYGYAIRLNRIEELSPTSYRETELRRIEPLSNCGWLATHTLSSAGGLTMLDAQHRRFKFNRTVSRSGITAATQRHGELSVNT